MAVGLSFMGQVCIFWIEFIHAQPGLALVILSMYGLNQQMEDLSQYTLSLSASLPLKQV